MTDTFEQWRQADRVAHEAERWARSLVRISGQSEASQRADIERAGTLRTIADALIDAAMQELDHEVARLKQDAPANAPTPAGVAPVWDRSGFLRAVAPQDASFGWMVDAVADIRQLTVGRPHARVLFDLTAVRRTPSLAEQTMLGEHVARQLAHVERAASLVPARARTGYSETAARSLGIELRVFTERAQATDWLQAASDQ